MLEPERCWNVSSTITTSSLSSGSAKARAPIRHWPNSSSVHLASVKNRYNTEKCFHSSLNRRGITDGMYRRTRRNSEIRARLDGLSQLKSKKQAFESVGAVNAGEKIWTSDRIVSIVVPPVWVSIPFERKARTGPKPRSVFSFYRPVKLRESSLVRRLD